MKRAALAIALMCVAWPVSAGEGPRVVELWPGKAPDEPGTIGPETKLMSKCRPRTSIGNWLVCLWRMPEIPD